MSSDMVQVLFRLGFGVKMGDVWSASSSQVLRQGSPVLSQGGLTSPLGWGKARKVAAMWAQASRPGTTGGP